MNIKMNLDNAAFDLIRSGDKDVEMRINDEKRQFIEVGDTIIFTNLTTRERLYATVLALHTFPSFKELYEAYDPRRIGYPEGTHADYKDMSLYYSDEIIKKYGALALEIQCVESEPSRSGDDQWE